MVDYPSDDSDKTWHMHDDLTWEWGINCITCHTGRGFGLQRAPMASTVPGGFNDSRGDARYKFQSNFDKSMDSYAAAVSEGLQPKAVSVEAVEQAKRTVKAQERAVKKIRKAGGDVSEVSFAPGVDVA